MGSRYKDFLKILAKCPVDPSKGERDIGLHLRNCMKLAFNSEKGFTGDAKLCDLQYMSLKRLTDNYYENLYKRAKTSSSSGLTAVECNTILSTVSLKFLEEENQGFFKKLIGKIKNR